MKRNRVILLISHTAEETDAPHDWLEQLSDLADATRESVPLEVEIQSLAGKIYKYELCQEYLSDPDVCGETLRVHFASEDQLGQSAP